MKFPPLRIVPVLVVAAVPLLSLKLFDIVAAVGSQAVHPAEASPVSPESKPPAAPASGATPASATAGTGQSAAGKDKPVAKTEDKPGSPPAKKPGDKAGEALADRDTVREAPRDPTSFSPAEIDLLQALSQRRAELDKRAADLDSREIMFKAAEQRIAEKIETLKKMEADINGLLQKKDDENEQKIKNIVKIYEIMKPQEAARIFEQLDMPVLIDVVQHMKEAKAAPILANMQPQKAKAVTLALAERQQVPKP